MSFASLDIYAQTRRERTKLTKDYGVPENERSEFLGRKDRLKTVCFQSRAKRLKCSGDDGSKISRLECSAADKTAVNVFLGKKLFNIARVH